MNIEKENKRVKIKTKKGKIITLSISKQTETHIQGIDKFGELVILPIEDIDSLFPYVDLQVNMGEKNGR